MKIVTLTWLIYTLGNLTFASCEDSVARSGRIGTGIGAYSLLPNSEPAFSDTVQQYGISVSVPFWMGAVALDGKFGSNRTVRLIQGELYYQLQFETPFLTPFVALGGDYLAINTSAGQSYEVGPLTGAGLTLSVSNTIQLLLSQRVYFHSTTRVALGVSFNYLW